MAKKPARPRTAATTTTESADWIDAAFASAAEAGAAQLGPDALAVKPLDGLRANQVIPLDSFIGTDRNWFSATFELAPAGDPRRAAQIAALRLAMGAFLTTYPETVSLVATAQSCPPAKPQRSDPPVVPKDAPPAPAPAPAPAEPLKSARAAKPAKPAKPAKGGKGGKGGKADTAKKPKKSKAAPKKP